MPSVMLVDAKGNAITEFNPLPVTGAGGGGTDPSDKQKIADLEKEINILKENTVSTIFDTFNESTGTSVEIDKKFILTFDYVEDPDKEVNDAYVKIRLDGNGTPSNKSNISSNISGIDTSYVSYFTDTLLTSSFRMDITNPTKPARMFGSIVELMIATEKEAFYNLKGTFGVTPTDQFEFTGTLSKTIIK